MATIGVELDKERASIRVRETSCAPEKSGRPRAVIDLQIAGVFFSFRARHARALARALMDKAEHADQVEAGQWSPDL